MPHATFPSLQKFLRGCMLLVLVLSGAFASAQALTNGNFEFPYAGPPPTIIIGWLKTKYINPGLAGATPYNGTSIVRNAGGTDLTNVVVSGGPETQVDPDLGAGQSLRWPKFGNQCVLINPQSSSFFGHGQNGNSVQQTFTLDASMIDPGDGRLHIRFAFAPVLENPGHPVNQQPYFNINVRDITKAGVYLYDNLNFSNQPGSPWKTTTSLVTGQTVVYTDWQVKDIALDPLVYLNDTIQMEYVAAGCSPSGHVGKLYVDGVAAVIPGLWVAVSADKTSVGTTTPPVGNNVIRYTYTVRNTGVLPQTNVKVDAIAPINTTVVPGSLIDPGGLLVPGGFPVLDNIGTLAPGASYTFSVDVTVNALTPAGTEITSGNYFASADNYGSLYGSPVKTYVIGAGTNLSVALAASLAACNTVFTATINNSGATASQAQASLPLPANTNLVSATTTRGLITGANPIVASLGDMLSGDSATFTVTVRPTTIASVSGTVTVSGNFADTTPADNISTAAIANATGGPAVSMSIQPLGATYTAPSTHTMTVAGVNGCGGLTHQWYLNGVAIPLATSTSYTTPLLSIGTYNYTARVTEGSGFYVISNVAIVTVQPLVTVAALTNGTLDASTPSPVGVPPGTSTSFKFNANPGYHVASISGCSGPIYTNTSNAVSTYTYTTGTINADCTVTATFAINTYQVTASPGANGALDLATPSPVTVNYGGSTSFTFNANANYHVASISGCSGPVYTNTSNAVATYTYTTGTINADCTVTATFALNTFQVAASAGANGTLDASTPSPVTVPFGSTASYKFNANPGYHVASISGCSGPVYTNTSNAVSTYTYTTGAISANCTVTATFAINTYQVTASPGPNGTLDPATPSPVTVNHGSSTSFTFNANANYHLASVSGCGGTVFTNTSTSLTTFTYNTGPITAACAVTATFDINPFVYNFSPASGGPGTAVIVTGLNMASVSSVTFNGLPATFTLISPTQISAIVPAGATTGPIFVTNSIGTQQTSSNFTVLTPAPRILSFSPNAGPTGTAVFINGMNLGGATGVFFNGVAASSFIQVSTTQIKAVVSAGATTGPISVTTPSGTGNTGTVKFKKL